MMKRLLGALLLCLIAAPASAGMHLGDYPTSATVHCMYNTNDQTGASITRSTDGTLKIFKNASTTERTSLAGVTQTEDFDSATGVHMVAIDTSDNTDAGFYAAGNEYHVVNTGMVIDTKTVNAHLCSFSIERSGGILALIKARTPNAAAGAAGGLFIAGTNAATTITTAGGAALTLSSTGANGQGLLISGNGSGAGLQSTGGATGQGMKLIGGGTSGEGLLLTTTSGDGIASTPTAGSALVLTANGTSKHGLVATGGTAGTSDGIKATAGTGGKDLRATTGITVDACTGCSSTGGTTIMPEAAYVKGSTSMVHEIFIKDSATNLGKTGLTNGSAGLTIAFGRADQGNAAMTTCAVQAATRGTYTSCGFVEKDATNAPGWYEFGLTTAMLATGADYVTVSIFGVSGTTPTQLPIALVDTGLAAINTKLGTPSGASMSADTAAVKTAADGIKAKTDSLNFTGANVNSNVQATAGTLTYNRTGDTTGNLSGSVGSVTGAVGSVTGAVGSVTGAVGSVTGNVGGNVVGSAGSVTGAVGSVTGNVGGNVVGSVGSVAGAVASVTNPVITGGALRKNVASQTFPYVALNSSGSSVTGLTLTVTVSKNGGAPGAITGSVAEISTTGVYLVSPSQADTNCDTCVFYFSGGTSVPSWYPFRTGP